MMAFLAALFATTPPAFREFHGALSDYVGVAPNFTLSDRGTVKIRLDNPPAIIPSTGVLDARARLEQTPTFHLLQPWTTFTLRMLSNNTFWLLAISFDDVWLRPDSTDSEIAPNQRREIDQRFCGDSQSSRVF
jgi:hypothetical protein